MDYSKIEAGKVALETASFSMDQVIQDVVNIVSYKIEEQEIGFKLSKDQLQKSLDDRKEDEINYLYKDFDRKLKKLLDEISEF